MSVYVDDMLANFGRMKMCHMIADTHDELIKMAELIGVNLKWIQHPNTTREHFDIALSKKSLALSHGAISITWKQCGAMEWRRRVTGSLGKPEESDKWLEEYYEAKKILRKEV